MKIQYGLSSFERGEGDLPALPVINMYAEEAQSEAGGIVLQSRNGIAAHTVVMGAGPVSEMLKKDGVLSGALFGVSDGELYQEGVSKGVIAGSGVVSITGSETGLFATAGKAPYFYDGTTLAASAFPDSANVIKLLEASSRIIALREASGKFYWTDALGSTFDALAFATAETEPDRLLDAVSLDDMLILFGTETVEFWPNTGDSTLPFQPLEGRVLEQGIKATGCAVVYSSTVAFVGNDNVIYDINLNPLSNSGLEEKIAKSTSCKLFTFQLDGHEMLALRLNGGTWVRSNRTGLWSEFQSYGQVNWLCASHAGDYFGSGVDGKIYTFGDDYSDAGGTLERRFRAGFPINGGGVHINNVRLRTNVGQTAFLIGDYLNPIVEMRTSRDAGQVWSNWKQRKLGKQGQYQKLVEWRAQGQASQPGWLSEFRVTDPVPFRVSGAFVNERYGGR